jgi:nucleoside-diphosphate-sugar epimerase
MKILVVGSEGNIGRHLVKHLEVCGHEVLCADIKNAYRPGFTQVDIVNPGELYPVVIKEKPEVIYNLAAMVSRVTCESSPHMAIDRNLSGVNNMIQLSKLVEAKLIAFSTSEVYGNQESVMSELITIPRPNNRYGLTKLLSEELIKYEVHNHGLKAVIVRPFMFYHEDEDTGDHRSMMSRFAHDLYARKQVEVHVGSSRGWLHMDDAVVALERAAYLDGFHTINIANPKITYTTDMAQWFCDIYGINYADYVIEKELPERMTLHKLPDVRLQWNLLSFIPTISTREGVERIARKVMQECG